MIVHEIVASVWEAPAIDALTVDFILYITKTSITSYIFDLVAVC